MTHYMRNGCSDYFIYMAFENKGVAANYISTSLSFGIGSAYPYAGWADVPEDKVPEGAKKLKVITDELLATNNGGSSNEDNDDEYEEDGIDEETFMNLECDPEYVFEDMEEEED